MRPIAFRCKKCRYIFAPIKRPSSRITRGREIFRIRCPKCKAWGKHLMKLTIKDFNYLWESFEKEYGPPESILQATKFISLDRISPNLIGTFIRSNIYPRDPKKTIAWLEKQGYGHQRAYAIANLLHEKFGTRKGMPKYEGKAPGPEGPAPEPQIQQEPEITIIESQPPTRPIIPANAPNCWGKWIGDSHCKNKCDARKSCRKEYEYQEYKNRETK